jgi:hypothetical protein
VGATGRNRDSYFLQLARYIVFNPVRLPLSNTPSMVWSSYGSMIGVTMVA